MDGDTQAFQRETQFIHMCRGGAQKSVQEPGRNEGERCKGSTSLVLPGEFFLCI